MKTLPVDYARIHMRELLDEAVTGNPVVLTRYAKPVALVLPASFLNIAADEVQAQPV